MSSLTNKQTKLKTKEFEEEKKNYRSDFGKKRSEKMWEIREFRKEKKNLTSFYATFLCGRYNIFKKILTFFFVPQNIEKLPKKVAHNPTRPPVFSPASFCFVKLRQF